MNIYVVVEGELGALRIYRHWIPYVNPQLRPVGAITEVSAHSVYLIQGFGQPEVWNVIERAVIDVNKLTAFDRLVIAVDAENKAPRDRQIQISEVVSRVGCRTEVRYIVHNFCMETWLLGNQRMFRKNSPDPEIREYSQAFNVSQNDPELLPSHPDRNWNRAQFAYHYLRAGIRDVCGENRPNYSKRNPGPVLDEGYYSQVLDRFHRKKHIVSFEQLLQAFAD